MDNQDTLFNKIKSAAENAESQDFPGMEKVWSRIDAKLDTKVEKKQNNNWKKLMIAASVVLVVSIGYQFLKDEKQIANPNNQIVTIDSMKTIISDTVNNAIVSSDNQNPAIKDEAEKILEQQIETKKEVVADIESDNDAKSGSYLNYNNDAISNKTLNNVASSKDDTKWMVKRNFESRAVEYKDVAKEEVAETTEKIKTAKAKKQEPLIIVDGEVSDKELYNLDEEELESIIELKEPLYIINSVYYTEQELFGSNPTSPYAPLNKQKIETISILQPDKAVSIYGEKGKKGIVIVTTKDGKPLPKKN